MLDYSYESLIKFLDYEAEKGLVNKNTIASRKGAVGKMLGILGEDERSDLRNIDVGDISRRFANLEGSRYTADSLQVYKSRLGKAIEEFLRYKDNPASFRVEGVGRTIKIRAVRREGDASTVKRADAERSRKTDESPSGDASSTSFDFPIPLRPGLIVYVKNLPVDLTEREAQRIGGVIAALSSHHQGLLPFQKEDA
jgi:hypothetical protein